MTSHVLGIARTRLTLCWWRRLAQQRSWRRENVRS